MKILSIGNFTTGWDGSICDEEHIAKTLEELGHEVIRQQRELGWDKPVPNVDFALIAQWDNYPSLKGFKEAKVPLVYWAFDYQADGQAWHESLISQADLYLSKRITDSKYPNWQWLSQDFAPKFLDKYPETVEKDIDILFTGSYLPWADERNATLKAIDDNFNLVIHSVTPDQWKEQGFKNVNGPIMDEGLSALYARAKINLSIDHTLEAGYWSDRNAQIMACGGFVLFRYIPMSETVFRENVAYFYSIDDCLEKISNLLRPDVAYIKEEYAQKGYEYAQKNLKVYNRVNDLLTIVGSIL